MKRSVRLLTLIICILLCLPFLLFAVSAEEQSIYTQNLQLSMEKKYLLDGQILLYSDKNPTGDVGASQTTLVIQEYQAQLSALGAITDVLMTDEINLTYAKGHAAGVLSWLYFSHKEVADVASVSEIYAQQRAKIDSAVGTTFFEGNETVKAEVEKCYTSMLSAIYVEKLNQEKKDTDSQTVKDLFAVAIDKIRDPSQFHYTDLDATEHQSFFGETVLKVTQQRNRDDITDQLAPVFELLYPEESYDTTTNEHISLFRGKLKEATAVAEMNHLLNQTVALLLEDLKAGDHVNTYLNSLKNATQAAVTNATASAQTAVILPIFDGYTVNVSRADLKDELELYEKKLNEDYSDEHKEDLAKLIDEYTKDGGILDGCSTLEELALEEVRAKLRADWFDAYVFTENAIDGYVGDTTDLKHTAEGEYLRTDRIICEAAQDDLEAQRAAVEEGAENFAGYIAQAEAQAFRNQHKDILEKQTSDITIQDKDAVANAIIDFEALSPMAQAINKDLKDPLGEKYKKAVRLEIQSHLRDDALKKDRKEQIEALVEQVEKIPTSDLGVLKEQSDLLVDKSEGVRDIYDRYEEILSDPNYSDYKKEFTDAMQSTVSLATDAIVDPACDTAEQVQDKTAEALLDLKKSEACAEITLAAKDSPLTEIKEILTAAKEEILAADTVEEIDNIADEAYLDIDKALVTEELRQETEEAKNAIDALNYLNGEDTAALKKKLDDLFAEIKDRIAAAETHEAIDSIENEFELAKQEALKEAARADLADAKEQTKDDLKQTYDTLVDIINGYTFIDAESKEQFLEDLENALKDANQAIDAASDVAEVEQEKDDHLKIFNDIAKDAAEEERLDCLAKVTAEVEGCFGNLSDYSPENQKKIQEILNDTYAKLEKANSVAEYLKLRDDALAKIALIPNLLEEAQAEAERRLTEVYTALMARKESYSAQNLAKLIGIYETALTEIQAYQKISDAPKVLPKIEERIAELQAIRLDQIYTEDKLLSTPEYQIPEGYAPNIQGYFGSVHSPNNLPYHASLTIQVANTDGIAKKLRLAAKNGQIFLFDGSSASKDLCKQLMDTEILAGFDIQCGVPVSIEHPYTVSILLNSAINTEHLVGVVFIREDGSVEFYEVQSEEDLLQFTTSHFSSYYLVSIKVVDLLPWIIVLSLILIGEVLTLLWLYHRRSQRREDEMVLASVAPFMGMGALRIIYRPRAGLPIVLILGVAVVFLGTWIVYFLIEEWRAKQAETIGETPVEEPEPIAELEESEAPILLPAGTAPAGELEAREELPVLEAPEEQLLLEPADQVIPLPAPEPVAPPVIEEAPTPMAFYQTFPCRFTFRRLGLPFAIINLDTLNASFEEGEQVTPDILKEKGLIAKRTGYVKILGRGELTKALHVKAQGFSAKAKQAILASGGEAETEAPKK